MNSSGGLGTVTGAGPWPCVHDRWRKEKFGAVDWGLAGLHVEVGSRAPEEVVVIIRSQPALGRGSEREVSLPGLKGPKCQSIKNRESTVNVIVPAVMEAKETNTEFKRMQSKPAAAGR